MKSLWWVVVMSFRMWWRDRSAVFWGIVFPILLMGLIGIVFGNSDHLRFTVSLVREGDSSLARTLEESLRALPGFKVVTEDRETALASLQSGERSLVVVVPGQGGTSGETPSPPAATSGLGAAAWAAFLPPVPQTPATVTLYYDETRAQVSQAGVALVQQLIDRINKVATGRPDIIKVEARGVSSRRLSLFDFLLPGVIAMTVMQTGLMGGSWVIANYRERKVLKRVLTTSVHPISFITGLVARFSLINLMQAAIIFLVGTLVFKAKMVGSLLDLAILTAVGSLAFLAMGFALSTVAKSSETANTLGSLVNFPMMFLSGTFWPKDMMPETIRPVVEALPLTPLVDAMRGVANQGLGLDHFWGSALYVLAWGVAAFAVAAWRFRWE